ncbi:MAG: cobalamin-dependent protein, partial [Bryobacteraceae bacterium]|nr:cobalamin-dependent protein [Bryobacteraceae bacterium]
MIVLVNPRITRPKNRRFPLSVLALAAVLEGLEDYCIVDGNLEPDLWTATRHAVERRPPTMLAVTVMPGPQLAGAVALCRRFRQAYPGVPIVWGGYFPSLYTDTALNADYVDFVVRGQGEDTLIELLKVLRSGGDLSQIRGLSYKDNHGQHSHNPRRPMRSPGDYPWFPYHRLEADRYILPTFLGTRMAVHQAS